MLRRDNTEEERKRIEAYDALAHPVDDGASRREVGAISPMYVRHDGEVFDDPDAEEDIIEGLDLPGRGPTE